MLRENESGVFLFQFLWTDEIENVEREREREVSVMFVDEDGSEIS